MCCLDYIQQQGNGQYEHDDSSSDSDDDVDCCELTEYDDDRIVTALERSHARNIEPSNPIQVIIRLLGQERDHHKKMLDNKQKTIDRLEMLLPSGTMSATTIKRPSRKRSAVPSRPVSDAMVIARIAKNNRNDLESLRCFKFATYLAQFYHADYVGYVMQTDTSDMYDCRKHYCLPGIPPHLTKLFNDRPESWLARIRKEANMLQNYYDCNLNFPPEPCQNNPTTEDIQLGRIFFYSQHALVEAPTGTCQIDVSKSILVDGLVYRRASRDEALVMQHRLEQRRKAEDEAEAARRVEAKRAKKALKQQALVGSEILPLQHADKLEADELLLRYTENGKKTAQEVEEHKSRKSKAPKRHVNDHDNVDAEFKRSRIDAVAEDLKASIELNQLDGETALLEPLDSNFYFFDSDDLLLNVSTLDDIISE